MVENETNTPMPMKGKARTSKTADMFREMMKNRVDEGIYTKFKANDLIYHFDRDKEQLYRINEEKNIMEPIYRDVKQKERRKKNKRYKKYPVISVGGRIVYYHQLICFIFKSGKFENYLNDDRYEINHMMAHKGCTCVYTGVNGDNLEIVFKWENAEHKNFAKDYNASWIKISAKDINKLREYLEIRGIRKGSRRAATVIVGYYKTYDPQNKHDFRHNTFPIW